MRHTRRTSAAFTLVELAVVLPGTPKIQAAAEAVFRRGLGELEDLLERSPWAVEINGAGYFALFFSPLNARQLKVHTCRLEEGLPWGRLWDMDCTARCARGLETKIRREAVGHPPRPCLLCGGPHERCIRRRAHPLEALRHAALRLAESLDRPHEMEVSHVDPHLLRQVSPG